MRFEYKSLLQMRMSSIDVNVSNYTRKSDTTLGGGTCPVPRRHPCAAPVAAPVAAWLADPRRRDAMPAASSCRPSADPPLPPPSPPHLTAPPSLHRARPPFPPPSGTLKLKNLKKGMAEERIVALPNDGAVYLRLTLHV